MFKDGEDDKQLAKRVAYKTVKMCLEEAKASGRNVVGEGYGVVAMDCEMICEYVHLSKYNLSDDVPSYYGRLIARPGDSSG